VVGVFELLSEPVRKYIRDKRWESLRPIQAAAIEKVMNSSLNLILASRTASGKTEAAFLPILSKVDFTQASVQVLYISPLIALINDQFTRIEDLCAYLDVKVTKWHGEASQAMKKNLVKNPNGVLLITPESLEAMLVNAPYNAKTLFSGLSYVVIDEIHSFIGADRGIQLKSILSRLQYLNTDRFVVVGLSATIGDYAEAKNMTGDPDHTKVLLDKTAKEMEATFKYFKMKAADLPLELMKDLYLNTMANKVLIFPNSRGLAEEIAVKLKKISDKVNGHAYYFSHHSSIDKELREYIEHFAKTNVRFPFAIACTSTLELGIDIGSVDKVVQIDATYSISSLIQRVGRSGRRDGEVSKLLFYATDKWNLLQSLACFDLYKEGFIEPANIVRQPFDILLHQMLAYVKQLSGCSKDTLWERVRRNYAFDAIDEHQYKAILKQLLELDLLELIGGELIIGVEGEWIVNNKDFYSVFKTEPVYKVLNYDKPIGAIPFSPQLIENENLLLAARIWKIIEVDHKAKKVSVIPTADGKKPIFSGSGADLHPKIRERMLQLLLESEEIVELDETSIDILREFRSEFKGYRIESLEDDRPALLKEGTIKLYTFHGTRVNKSLHFLFDLVGQENNYLEHTSSFTFTGGKNELLFIFKKAIEILHDIDFHVENLVAAKPAIMEFSKWGHFLPLQMKCRLLNDKYFDFSGARDFLERVNVVVVQ
ncbi:MAG TPA: DEAD/DEAH box helicase, partial [Pedobacter sp.]